MPRDLATLRQAALDALRALQHVEAADGIPELADDIAGLIVDLTDAHQAGL